MKFWLMLQDATGDNMSSTFRKATLWFSPHRSMQYMSFKSWGTRPRVFPDLVLGHGVLHILNTIYGTPNYHGAQVPIMWRFAHLPRVKRIVLTDPLHSK